MPILVKKIWEGVRLEGLNYGLPEAFLELGEGIEYSSSMELLREFLKVESRWVCIRGTGSTQVGFGSLVKGFGTINLNVELECDGSVRNPGWLNSVDRWVVDFSEEPLFDYYALRTADMLRFTIRNEKDLETAKRVFGSLKLFPGTKYLKMLAPVPGAEELVRKYDRTRIYYEGKQH